MKDNPADESRTASDELLHADEVLPLLGMHSRKRLYAAAAKGDVPSVRIGRSVRFSRRQLEAFIANGGTRSDTQPRVKGEAERWEAGRAIALQLDRKQAPLTLSPGGPPFKVTSRSVVEWNDATERLLAQVQFACAWARPVRTWAGVGVVKGYATRASRGGREEICIEVHYNNLSAEGAAAVGLPLTACE